MINDYENQINIWFEDKADEFLNGHEEKPMYSMMSNDELLNDLYVKGDILTSLERELVFRLQEAEDEKEHLLVIIEARGSS